MTEPLILTRRTLLFWLMALPAAEADEKMVSITEYTDAGKKIGVKTVPKLVKTEDEWRRMLEPSSFEVTRHADTEREYSGATWDLKDKGIYRCVCCDTALFSSSRKYKSGTGWPSFWAPLDSKNIQEHVDRSLREVRTAIACRLCDAHLGHVFEDGPPPTGRRYCMNSVAMRFARA